ncbi:MAG: hypothetical protein ACREAO_00950 [Nitrososphaera sp.]
MARKSGTRSVKKYVIIGAIGAAILVSVLYALSVTRPPGSTAAQNNEDASLPGGNGSALPGTANSPYITILPNPYSLGEPATIAGFGFTPNEEITLTLNKDTQLQTTPSPIITDSAGTFEVETAINETEGEGEQIITAVDASGIASSTTLPLNPESTGT